MKFRLTKDEKQKLDKRIHDANIGRENFLRKSVLNKVIIIEDLKHFNILAKAVDKVGVNVNQIAKVANQTKYISKDDIEIVKKRVEAVWRLLRSKRSKKHLEKR